MAENYKSRAAELETIPLNLHPLISWRAAIAGLVITTVTFLTLIALGMAMGGIGLQDGTTAQNVGIFVGFWFLLASILALFAGGYFAARMTPFHTARVGAAHGLLIAGVFFGFLLWQTVSAIGWVGSTAGSAAAAGGSKLMQMADNSAVADLTEEAIGDLIKTEVRTVAAGVASRLMRGDTEGAKAYLAQQTGVAPDEANKRLTALQAKVDQSLVQAREKTAGALKASGWSLFLALLLGVIAGSMGGALGSRANLRRPISREQAETFEWRSAG